MLNELEHLAGNVARVLRRADALAAENQRLHAEVERLQAEAETARTRRDAMLAERGALNARIEAAQRHIQSILDTLPTAANARAADDSGPNAETAHALGLAFGDRA